MYNIISRGWITTTALITCLSGQVRDLPRLLSPHRTGPAGKEVHVLCLFAAVYVSLSMNSVRAPGRPRKRVQRYALFHSPPNIAETFFREKQLFPQKRKIHLLLYIARGGRLSKCQSVKVSKAEARESHGQPPGGTRTEIRDSHADTKNQDESPDGVSLSKRKPPEGEMRTVSRMLSAFRRIPSQKVRWNLYAESLQTEEKNGTKPAFHPLPTRLKISLRQEISVFAARNKFLSAKKFHFDRMKTGFKPKKCAIQAFPGTTF